MATKELKTTPKISVNIWCPILDKLDEKLESACLRRDAYLSKILKTEVELLDREISIPNSKESNEYVFRELHKLKLKLVSLALPPEISARLNEVCATKRIVRDAFFNRLFLLLAAKPTLIDELIFGTEADNWRREVWREAKHDETFFQDSFYPLGSIVDPFWAIRMGIEHYAEDNELEDYLEPTMGKAVKVSRDPVTDTIEPAPSLYATVFRKTFSDDTHLLGLSCYLPDREIPGTDAEQTNRSVLDEL
jgi:hypothetical protein